MDSIERVRIALPVLLGFVLVACGTSCGWPTGPNDSQLRVMNVGSRTIEGLVVLFPGERVEFGDLAAGGTTSYRAVGDGVYSYAAYEFRAGSRVQSQPVTDWVGEEPMDGRAFTYSLELVDAPSSGVRLRLVSTSRDE